MKKVAPAIAAWDDGFAKRGKPFLDNLIIGAARTEAVEARRHVGLQLGR